jgi:hypothetical protein
LLLQTETLLSEEIAIIEHGTPEHVVVQLRAFFVGGHRPPHKVVVPSLHG